MIKQLKKERFLKAYDEFSDAIFRYCYFKVSDREKAKDLTQATFARTWGYIARGGEIENIKAFLYRVANNLIIDDYRTKKEHSLEEMQEKGFDPGFDDREKLCDTIDDKETLEVIKKLEPKYRESVTMRYINDLSPKEIARILDESENVISVRIHRGLKQLKNLLNENNEK